VRQLTNSAGAVTDEYEYDAFGNSFTVSGAIPNNYLYRGEQFDPDLGMYYLRARYYNPATGRFCSRDPKEGQAKIPASLHKYLYAGGDPVNRIDPFGREDFFEFASIVVQETEDMVGLELMQEEMGKILMCLAFDLLEEGLAEVKFPWWYCELGTL